MRLDIWNPSVVELDACVEDLKKRIEHNSSQMRVAESQYLLLIDKAQMLKLRLATGVSGNGRMEQRLTDASMDV